MLKSWMNLILTFIFILASENSAQAKVVKYELKVTSGRVNLSGKKTVHWALMINGSIPGPVLEFTEGDDAEITVHNELKEEVSMHWHGILLPPEMDGVAHVNTPPINPKSSFTFKFRIRQHGTYWYHSHTNVQEQKGLYGGIVVHPKNPTITYDKDVVAVLSDWSDENANEILKNLRKDGDYYQYKKKSIRSLTGAFQANALGTYFKNEISRMKGMDLSDVGYDVFLINGKPNNQLFEGKPGDKIRIRLINAAASTYFYVSLGQSPMNVISADGMDVAPTQANEILMGMGETYDVLYELPANKKIELRATAQDQSGSTSGWIGKGEKEPALDKPPLNLYAPMDHATHSQHEEDHQNHDDHMEDEHASHDEHHDHGETDDKDVIPTIDVTKLQARIKTAYGAQKPKTNLELVLGGDMDRYVWHINGKAIHEEYSLPVKESEVVRFTFNNQTMMHHPMHLHGHFFRVLNESGEFSPLKHTVDVPPHGSRTIEFFTNEPGRWMLHCHNLYHMKTGMARILEYKSFQPDHSTGTDHDDDPHAHDHIYYTGSTSLFSQFANINLALLRTWDSVEFHAEVNQYRKPFNHGIEGLYRRWLSNYLSLIAGIKNATDESQQKPRAFAGFSYTLPLLVRTEISLDQKGTVSVEAEKKLQWTDRVYSDLVLSVTGNDRPDIEINLMYASDWHWAAGFAHKNKKTGVGIQYRF